MHHDHNLVIISIPDRLRKNLINHSLIAVQVVSTKCLQKINIFNSVPNEGYTCKNVIQYLLKLYFELVPLVFNLESGLKVNC